MRKIQKYIAITLTLLGSIVPMTANADILLVISSSGGMFGSNQASEIMEKFGAALVAHSLKKNYRAIYTWNETNSKLPFSKLWDQILRESRSRSEPVDVFAMEHGPNHIPLDQLSDLDAAFQSAPAGTMSADLSQRLLSSIPYRSIRRFYSTACSEWGEFSTDLRGINFSSTRTPHISDSLKTVGISEYIIQANDNSSGLFTLPYLISEFRRGDSWISAGKRAFDHFDREMGDQVESIQRAWSQTLIKEKVATLLGSWTDMLISRPVFGGESIKEYADLFLNRTYYADDSEKLMRPDSRLIGILERLCPTTFDGKGGDGSKCSDLAASNSTLAEAVQTLGNVVQSLFASYAGNSNGCVDVTPFQELLKFVKGPEGESPAFESLCFSKIKNGVELTWTLAPTPMGRTLEQMGQSPESVAGQDIWLVKPIQEVGSVNNSPISKIGLERQGSVSISTKGPRATLAISGVTISLGKIEAVPGIARPFTKHVGIRSLSILENGDFVAKLSAPLFSLPFKVNGNAEKESVDNLKLFGLKFRL